MTRFLAFIAAPMLLLSACGSDAGTESDKSPSAADPVAIELVDDAGSASVDPATVEGACEILVGKGTAVEEAMGLPATGATEADALERSEIQDKLFAVVAASNPELSDAAGQLVDFLDDPAAYVTDGELSADVADAVASINSTCDNS